MWKKFWNDKKGIIILILVLTVVSLSAAAFFANKNGKQMKADSDITVDQKTAEEKKETAEKQQEEKQPAQSSSQQLDNKSIQSSTDKEKAKGTSAGNKKVASSNVNTQEKSKQPENPKKSFIDKVVDKITGNDDKKPEDTKIKQYKVTFYTEGGSKLEARKVNKGTKIGSLPTPYRDNYIFVSWYYDKNREKLASKEDEINSNVSLYAEYAAQTPLENVEQVTFASATGVKTDFKIIVKAKNKKLNLDTVKAGITASNLTDPKQTDIIEVTGGNGTFTIAGKNPVSEDGKMEAVDGFAEGCTYRVALTDTRLCFEDQPKTVREYNFTTDKKQVLNTSLNDGIVYIPIEDISNITSGDKSVETLSIALYQADKDGTLGPANMTQGEFDYTKGELHLGDIVSIYAGLRPDKRTLDTPKEENGELAYVEITARNGNRYSYKNAQPEDVIFEPDMLPIPIGADMDEAADTITVENQLLDYSADVYANIELDSRTTVDVGDFIMFYSGTFGVESGSDAAKLEKYGKITGVKSGAGDTTTIGFTEVGWDEVQQAMDIYAEDTMTGTDMLEGVDTAALEAQIEQQALESGFAEEAAQYLGSMALATENFTKLSENLNLEDYKVTLEDGTPVSPEELQLMASNISAKCEMEQGYPKATISTHPTKLNQANGTAAKDKGLSVQLEVQAKITIGKQGSNNQLVINISGTFAEEVGIDLGVRSKAVWKVWGIFPYIAEYRVTANVDILNYTGVEVNAMMMTQSNDESGNEHFDEGVEIAGQIKDLIDSNKENGEDDESEEGKSNLIKRYSEMMKGESDWVRVIEQNIVDNEQQVPPPFPIIAINTEIDFVVKMNACISVGFDFEYMTGKRYTYTIDVFAGAVYNDTVTLLEETYQFDFYTMGRLEIKAGLEFEFKIGLFTTDLASVGFRSEAGAYSKLWGYFYYELRYSTSNGRDQQYNGAMLIDVGAYLEVGLKAQALKDTFSTELKLYDNEWSLWTVGRQDNVLDFATKQEEMPNIKLKQHVRDAMLPDAVFSMDYLDLKDGQEKQAIYNDDYDSNKTESLTNRKNFDIRMTNDKFTYDPKTNTVSVNPEKDDKKLEGEMIITWIRYPLAFSSRPIQRTISLYWDNLRDGYVIVPYTNGGTYINIINAKFEAKVEKPADPVKPGYDFAGWYSDEALTEAYEFPESMPAADTNIYAKWVAKADTPYRVEYYTEQLRSGEYELAEVEELTGTTESFVTPEIKEYVGYRMPAEQEIKISADGSSVLRYYYALENHTVTFDPGEVGGEKVTYDLKYGGTIIAPMMAAKGYTFTGWDSEVASSMGTENLVYTAQWTKNPDTAYRVEYYVQDIDGKYKLKHLHEGMGFTGEEISADTLRNLPIDGETTAEQKYVEENGVVFENLTVNGLAKETAVVEGSGKSIIKINYKREKYKISFSYGYDTGDGEQSSSQESYYGDHIHSPEKMQRTGYTFIGWSTDGVNVVEPDNKMGTGDVAYTALWKANTYTVQFDKNHDAATGEMEQMQFAYDERQNLHENAFVLDGYDFLGWTTRKGTGVEYENTASVLNLTAENEAAVTLYAVWKMKNYNIIYNGAEGLINTNPSNYNVETETITLMDPVRKGYTFKGWYENEACEGEVVREIKKGSVGDKVFYAKWEANTDTSYKVEHYKEALDWNMVLADTDELKGTSDSQVTLETKNYEGFIIPEVQTVSIAADGSTCVRYEYKRKDITVTLNVDGGILPEGVDSIIYGKYESELQLPIPVREGYGFEGWYVGEEKFTSHTMPAEDTVLQARWVAGQYGYTVNYYQQNVDGSENYTLKESVHQTAAMDSVIEPELKQYTGFTAPEKAKQIIVTTDERANVADYYYTRNKYSLSWELDGGTAAAGYTEGQIYYDAPIIAPIAVKDGNSCVWNMKIEQNMPAKDLAYKAVWTPQSYQLTMEPNGGYVTGDGELLTKTVTYGTAYDTLPKLEKEGYTFAGWYSEQEGGTEITGETLVTATGDHTIYARFIPINYKIDYYGADGATNTNPVQYNIETGLLTLSAAEKEGYRFEGWHEKADLSDDAVVAIPAKSTGDIILYAKWSENRYKVVFHSNNEEDRSKVQNFSYTEVKMLDTNRYVREGYTFAGWSLVPNGEVVYANCQTVSKLSAVDQSEVHLYAVWTSKAYQILYENMDGAENAPDNPTEFTVVSNTFNLHEPVGKPGYTFDGWYSDSSLTKKVSGTIILDALHDWRFYAKWNPNPYTVTFDSCLGDTVPVETQLMMYDEADNLELVSEMRNFKKPGYTFTGWALEKDGTVVYKDGQNVKNLAGEGNVTLYAVWELNVFKITYNLGAGGISQTNPESYSIEDNDIQLEAPDAKDGYQFLGWYDGDTLVSEIVKGAQKDYKLTAKWGYGGTFNLVYVGKEDNHLIYKVTRTLPEGTVPTTNPQHIYYRTVNGTAYGSTVDSESDKCHFKHVGGEDVYLTFGQNDMEKTFTIEEWGMNTTADSAAGFQLNNTARYYNIELYKIVDTIGTCGGVLGEQTSCQRVIDAEKAYCLEDLIKECYNQWHSYTIRTGDPKINNYHYYERTPYTFNSLMEVLRSKNVDEAKQKYIAGTATNAGFRMTSDLNEVNDGYLWFRFYGGGAYFAEYKLDLQGKGWKIDVPFPYNGSKTNGAEYESKSHNGQVVFGSPCYARIGINDRVQLELAESGKGKNDWQFGTTDLHYMILDNRAPQQVGVSCLALGQYKAGEQISITVHYDEVIKSASNIGLLGVANIPLTNVQYAGGEGTNALTFTATLAQDFEVTPNVNNDIKNLKPVTGTVKDVFGN